MLCFLYYDVIQVKEHHLQLLYEQVWKTTHAVFLNLHGSEEFFCCGPD
jgi:hypothetical protein